MAEGESTSGHSAGNGADAGSVPSPPPPPVPAADPRLHHDANSDHQVASPTLAAQVDDIFKISPLAALRMLSAGIEALVEMTGDIPPTPPPKSPSIPHLKGMEEEKKSIVRSNSGKNLALLAQARGSASSSPRPPRSPLQKVQCSSELSPTSSAAQAAAQDIDGVRLRTPNPATQTQQPSPPAEQPPPPAQQQPLVPYIIVGDNSQPLNLQHSAITRKFYCRTPPPISITDYLLRIHNYCPMSTGVYLATSLYMHRLAVSERAIVVTRRNAHRLLLAGLRVAMKALEDQSYPHVRFARVGGVSERELARLEISFCFLTGFELTVNVALLTQHWELLRRGTDCWNAFDVARQERPFQLGKPPARNDVKAQA